VREGAGTAAKRTPVPSTHQTRCVNTWPLHQEMEPMMRTNPTGHTLYPSGWDEPDCLACATGWHAHCRWPDFGQDDDGELVERCCDGLLIARRRRPLWTR
jgi:hypothetical protein